MNNVKQYSKDDIVELILKWKFGWMNQQQNSGADYQNYFNRASGVDANMQHSLAGKIVEKYEPVLNLLSEMVEILEYYKNRGIIDSVRDEALTKYQEFMKRLEK